MSGHADTIRPERVERVEQWANLYGNELADILRLDPEDDAATLDAIDDALMLVEDVYAARHERDALLAERQQLQQQREWEFTKRGEALAELAKCERERQQAQEERDALMPRLLGMEELRHERDQLKDQRQQAIDALRDAGQLLRNGDVPAAQRILDDAAKIGGSRDADEAQA